jgi:uncharacterized protein YciI
MNYYAIMSTDVEQSLPLRKTARPDHLARLHELDQQGRLLLAGPHPMTNESEPEQPAFSGSLVVAAFASLAEAEDWAQADPYVAAGVYAEVSIKPFLPVLPAPK